MMGRRGVFNGLKTSYDKAYWISNNERDFEAAKLYYKKALSAYWPAQQPTIIEHFIDLEPSLFQCVPFVTTLIRQSENKGLAKIRWYAKRDDRKETEQIRFFHSLVDEYKSLDSNRYWYSSEDALMEREAFLSFTLSYYRHLYKKNRGTLRELERAIEVCSHFKVDSCFQFAHFYHTLSGDLIDIKIIRRALTDIILSVCKNLEDIPKLMNDPEFNNVCEEGYNILKLYPSNGLYPYNEEKTSRSTSSSRFIDLLIADMHWIHSWDLRMLFKTLSIYAEAQNDLYSLEKLVYLAVSTKPSSTINSKLFDQVVNTVIEKTEHDLVPLQGILNTLAQNPSRNLILINKILLSHPSLRLPNPYNMVKATPADPRAEIPLEAVKEQRQQIVSQTNLIINGLRNSTFHTPLMSAQLQENMDTIMRSNWHLTKVIKEALKSAFGNEKALLLMDLYNITHDSVHFEEAIEIAEGEKKLALVRLKEEKHVVGTPANYFYLLNGHRPIKFVRGNYFYKRSKK